VTDFQGDQAKKKKNEKKIPKWLFFKMAVFQNHENYENLQN
jgi:hypothetical protein